MQECPCGFTREELLNTFQHSTGPGMICVALDPLLQPCGRRVVDHPTTAPIQQLAQPGAIGAAALAGIVDRLAKLLITRSHGVSTEAEWTQALKSDRDLVPDISFDHFLCLQKQIWWPTENIPMFPMLGEMEVTSCRTFIEEMVAKIDEGLPKKFGRGFLRVSKKVQAINELVSSPTSSSFSGRKPHLVSYMPLRRGACSITMLGDVKGRSSNGDFPDAEVGHILDMARVLMTEHQFTRPFLIVFLTDGFRFQYFKCSRQSSDTFKYTSSIVYTETAGWQILLGLLMLTHLDLGLVLDNIPGWNLVKGLGTGRFARVYAAQECDSDSGPVYVLKVFQNCQIGIHEENILSRLAHLNIANIPVVHTSVRPLDGTFGLLVTPIGMPILPAPSGMVINPLMFNKLLEVLETVHGLGIIHRDVKPENIILLGEGEIILDDWGSAVDINSSCSYQGTPVYGVENQGVQIATRALDLHCLVKTVFTIKQQNFPPSGLNWKQIQEHWTGISKTFPLFPTVLDCADNEDYESLRRYFSDLWC